MYRVTVSCEGIAPGAGDEGAADIEQEFREHRTWHRNPKCSFANGRLTLTVENEVDEHGQATLDEFTDCVLAYIGEHGPIRVANIQTF